MRAGRLDRRITLSRMIRTDDSYGEAIPTWVDLATVWAEMLPVRGAEWFVARQTIAEVDTKFRIRYRVGITPLDRVTLDGRYYDVQAVIELGRREGLEIYAKARAE